MDERDAGQRRRSSSSSASWAAARVMSGATTSLESDLPRSAGPPRLPGGVCSAGSLRAKPGTQGVVERQGSLSSSRAARRHVDLGHAPEQILAVAAGHATRTPTTRSRRVACGGGRARGGSRPSAPRVRGPSRWAAISTMSACSGGGDEPVKPSAEHALLTSQVEFVHHNVPDTARYRSGHQVSLCSASDA